MEKVHSQEFSMIFFINEHDEIIYWQSIQNIDTYAEIGADLRLGVRDSSEFNVNKYSEKLSSNYAAMYRSKEQYKYFFENK